MVSPAILKFLHNRTTPPPKKLALRLTPISGYIEHRQAQKAINLFNESRNPNAVISILFFKACAQIRTSETNTESREESVRSHPTSL